MSLISDQGGCRKGGMRCERRCEERPGAAKCQEVLVDVCEDEPEEICDTVIEKHCRTVQEELCEDTPSRTQTVWVNIFYDLRCIIIHRDLLITYCRCNVEMNEVCEVVKDEVCTDESKMECSVVNREICTTIKEEVCSPDTFETCEEVEKVECRMVPDAVCRNVTETR